MESLATLRQYLELRSKQLRLDLEAAALFVGKTEIGSVVEDAIRRFLKASLPARFSVGIGEVISSQGQTASHSQSKDVIIYDSTYSPIFGWGDTGFHLFPVESVYAIIEVKKMVDTAELLKGIRQATEARSLVDRGGARPFTSVVAFTSKTNTETLARNIEKLPPKERVDFVLILNRESRRETEDTGKNTLESDYIAHWYYHSPGLGGGSIDFVTCHQAHLEEKKIASAQRSSEQEPERHIYLTWGQSEHALMWFYLFLLSNIGAMEARVPNLWHYTRASQANLGYRGNC